MRFMQMDDYEFIAMKACVLFNPVARGLNGDSVMKVLQTRRKIFAALENYINSKTPNDPNRIGDLTFFILSPLQSLAKSLSEDVLMTKMSGAARIDQLMEELILEDTDPKEKPQEGIQRQISETERKLSNPVIPRASDSMGTHNSGNYGYDMLSTLSDYIMDPQGFNRSLSPLTDPFLNSIVAQSTALENSSTSNNSLQDSPKEKVLNHSSSISPVTKESTRHPASGGASCPNFNFPGNTWVESTNSYDTKPSDGGFHFRTSLNY